jgi:hypothetical protein
MRLAYLWTGPNSLLGVGGALLARTTGGEIGIHDGVLEAWGGALSSILPRLPAATGVVAITLGHVVLAVSQAELEKTRAHERVHVRQYERWGPFFIPAYLAASGFALVQGRDPYHDNHFEREAFANA